MKSLTYHIATSHTRQVDSYEKQKPKTVRKVKEDNLRTKCLNCPFDDCKSGECPLIK